MNRLVHLALGSPDVAKTAKFYKEVFSLHEVERAYERGGGDNPPDAMLRRLWLSDGYMGFAICKVSTVPLYHFGFVVDNMDQTLKRLKAAGGSLMRSARPGEVLEGEVPRSEIKWRGPEGVTIDLSEQGWHWPGQTAQGVRGKIQHLALGTPDVVKTANFYQEGFGLHEVDRAYKPGAGDNPPDELLHRIFLSDGYMDVAICKEPVLGMYHFGFTVDNMDETLERLKARGGSLISSSGPDDVLGPEEHRHYRALVKFRGPEGARIDLSTRG